MDKVIILGCGAIGSYVAEFLASDQISLELVDDDIVEHDNIETSAYGHTDIGQPKVMALTRRLWQDAHCQAMPHNITLDRQQMNFILHRIVGTKTSDSKVIVVDCFDNSEARSYSVSLSFPTLHCGVSGPNMGSTIWNEHYTLHQSPERGEDTFCTHMMGKAILRHTASLAANVIIHYLETGEKLSFVSFRMRVVEWIG